MVIDFRATSSCGQTADPFVLTGRQSMKVFQMSFGHTANMTAEAQLHTEVRKPARTVDIVPALKCNSLLSISKFAEASYIIMFTPDEVQIFDGEKG